MKKPSLLFFVLFAFSLGCSAQQNPAQATKTVIHAAHLLDVKTGHMLDNVTMVIEGDKIASIGTGPAPAGANVIDLPNATLLPGLIDAHTHLTFDPNFG